MRVLIFGAGVLSALAAMNSCGEAPKKNRTPAVCGGGRGCSYRQVAGVAEILAIDSSEDPATVTLKFAPDGQEAEPDSGKMGLSAACLQAQGIKVGSQVSMIEFHETQGCCIPIYYELAGIVDESCHEF